MEGEGAGGAEHVATGAVLSIVSSEHRETHHGIGFRPTVSHKRRPGPTIR